MSSSDLDQQLRSRIESFVQDLSAIVRRAALEAVREALGVGRETNSHRGDTVIRGRIGHPTRTSGGGGKRRRRRVETLERLQAKFVAYVKRNPGKGIEEIAEAIGESSKELRFPVQKLIAARKVKTVGQKRGTRYHAA